MKIFKTERVPASTREVCVEVRCDLCPAIGKGSWEQGLYEINKTTVEVRKEEGSSYPEGGSKETVAFDICPACFESVLIPFMISRGAQPQRTESDW